MMAKGTGSMTKDMKSALEVLAEATESHLGKHPVSRSVSDLAAQPPDNNIKTTQHVFDRLPAEDKIRVSRIAEEAAKSALKRRKAHLSNHRCRGKISLVWTASTACWKTKSVRLRLARTL